MTTSYCSVAQWAKRHGGYATFAAYTAAQGDFPSEDELQEALDEATEIMNDSRHINCKSTNVTDSDYTNRLEAICSRMADRMLDIRRSRGGGGFGMQQWSQADFLMSHERGFLLDVGLAKGYLKVGDVEI